MNNQHFRLVLRPARFVGGDTRKDCNGYAGCAGSAKHSARFLDRRPRRHHIVDQKDVPVLDQRTRPEGSFDVEPPGRLRETLLRSRQPKAT